MQKITLRSHVGEDGILHLDIPVETKNAELEVTLTIQVSTPEGKGWTPGFFAETFGSFKDDPLVIDSEGVFEEEES